MPPEFEHASLLSWRCIGAAQRYRLSLMGQLPVLPLGLLEPLLRQLKALCGELRHQRLETAWALHLQLSLGLPLSVLCLQGPGTRVSCGRCSLKVLELLSR